jgi:hypothetical protein
MRRNVTGHLSFRMPGRAYLLIIRPPLRGSRATHKVCITFPPWWFCGPNKRTHLFECLAFGFQICTRIAIGSVETRMSKPATNHGHINSCRHKANRCRVSKRVRLRIDVLLVPGEHAVHNKGVPQVVNAGTSCSLCGFGDRQQSDRYHESSAKGSVYSW